MNFIDPALAKPIFGTVVEKKIDVRTLFFKIKFIIMKTITKISAAAVALFMFNAAHAQLGLGSAVRASASGSASAAVNATKAVSNVTSAVIFVMDGYEATKKIREKGITIPIIALTASLPKEVEAQTKEKGMTDIVVKPFNPDELYRKILHYTNVYRSL